MQTFSTLFLVICLKHLLQTLHNYFTHSAKRHLEYTKLVEMLEMKGNKILRNVKTRWISLLSLAKRVMAKYRTFLVKMVLDNLTNQHLCDFQILLGLPCILTLLEFVHALIKFAQIRDVFVCDLMAIIKVNQRDLYNMYLEQSSNFITNIFWVFKSLLECKHENIHMKWILDIILDSIIWHLR
jgi:hypothetical protein